MLGVPVRIKHPMNVKERAEMRWKDRWGKNNSAQQVSAWVVERPSEKLELASLSLSEEIAVTRRRMAESMLGATV